LVPTEAVFSLLALLQHLSPFFHSFFAAALDADFGEVCAETMLAKATKANRVNNFLIFLIFIVLFIQKQQDKSESNGCLSNPKNEHPFDYFSFNISNILLRRQYFRIVLYFLFDFTFYVLR